jgi:hypothetical protein
MTHAIERSARHGVRIGARGTGIRSRALNLFSFAFGAVCCDMAIAAADITIRVEDADVIEVASSAKKVVIRLNENAAFDISGLVGAKATTHRGGGSVTYTVPVAADEAVAVSNGEGGKTVRIKIAKGGSSDPAATSGAKSDNANRVAANEPAKEAPKTPADGKPAADKADKPAADKTVESDPVKNGVKEANKLLDKADDDFGVPAAPALTLLGLTGSQASHPASPKDVAAALVNGRGADGKVKAGVALDISAAQLLEALPLLDMSGVASAPKSAAAEGTNKNLKQTSGVATKRQAAALESRLAAKKKSGESTDANPENNHTFANRLKVSIATTEDQQTAGKGTDAAFGLHYTFIDGADPLTTDCDGVNSLTQSATDLSPKQLLALRLESGSLYDAVKNKSPDSLETLRTLVIASCTLTESERLGAQAAAVGVAHSYRLEDQTWSNRQSGATGFWATWAAPGYGVGSYQSTVFQPILHTSYTRNQLIVDATDTTKFHLKSQKLGALKLRFGTSRGAGAFEFTRSLNSADGKKEAINRQAFSVEWKLSPGIWLVGSAGNEKSSLNDNKPTSFVTTNLRFGGSPLGGTAASGSSN